MRKNGKHLDRWRIDHPAMGKSPPGSLFGAFIIQHKRRFLTVISGGERDGTEDDELTTWEHVSVSVEGRPPTWEELCFVKEQFWGPNETVIQFHPRRSEYVNEHPHCLHMWRNAKTGHQLPPRWTVGVESKRERLRGEIHGET